MNRHFPSLCQQRLQYQDFLDRLRALFATMDAAYEAVAGHYGFHCSGCPDNCCQTRFFHHTLVEYLYLYEGFCRMSTRRQLEIRKRAKAVAQKQTAAESGGDVIRVLCPLNEDEKCLLYRHRPMICRLHGLPHLLQRPGGQTLQGTGCDEFHRRCGESIDRRLDRTGLYREMAQLESAVRNRSACREKFKMTVARMILSFPAAGDGDRPFSPSEAEEKHAENR